MTRVLTVSLVALCVCVLTSEALPQTNALPPVLGRLIGEWRAANGAVMRAVSVAGGHGIYSEYTFEDYDAVALWTYHSPTNAVRMLETNSHGMVMLHVGEIDSAESLTLLCYSNRDPELLVKQVSFRWEGDALYSSVVFFKNGEPTDPQQFEFERVGP